MLNHYGNDSSQQGAVEFKTRVGVDLDQPRFQLIIQHKVQAKYLKIIHLPLSINVLIIGLYYIGSDVFHFRQYLFPKIYFIFGIMTIKISLEFVIGKFISRLKLTIVL